EVNLPAIHEEFAACLEVRRVTKDAQRQLGAPRTHQSRKADNFAFAHIEVDILEDIAVLDLAVGAPVTRLKDNILRNAMGTRGVNVVNCTTHHVLDQDRLRNFAL